jgi:4-amino-4-deoxy-L-arabinose transferase-like glycosyltransferase
MSNDVKTDGLLTGFIMLALWQGSVLLKERSRSSIMLFSLALALALMTKGPLGFILPCGAIGLHLILTRQLKLLLRKELLLILPLVVLLISPMCIGLYEQFDMHPEKEVYGLKGPSGLRFFFYTQSFGRLTGEIYWNNGAPWHFFLLSMLWDFAPWVLFFWSAIISMIKNSAIRKQIPEFMSLALFAIGMLGLSASNYKLPHYIFPLFPACAIPVAVFLQQQQTNIVLRLSLKILALLFSIVPLIAFALIFPANTPAWLFALMNLFCVVYFGFLLRKELWALFISLSAFGMVLSLWFYPELLGFQSSSTAGHYISENSSPSDNIFFHQVHGHALDFYSGRISRAYNKEATRRDWIYTTQSHGDSLLRSGDWELKADMNDFHISRLSGKFLFSENKKTYCKKIYLMQKIK